MRRGALDLPGSFGQFQSHSAKPVAQAKNHLDDGDAYPEECHDDKDCDPAAGRHFCSAGFNRFSQQPPLGLFEVVGGFLYFFGKRQSLLIVDAERSFEIALAACFPKFLVRW